MNERIKELYEKSLDRVNRTDYNGNPVLAIHQNPTKFAELIIQECANVLLNWKDEPFPFDEDVAVSLIKEHFGIEK